MPNARANIIHGDCIKELKDIPSESVDLILIDPPYGGMVNAYWDRKSEGESVLFFKEIAEQSHRILRPGGRFISFASNQTLKHLYASSLLSHRELLTFDKDVKKVSAGRSTKQYRQHINNAEYAYVATKENREHCRQLLLEANNGRLSSKQINELLGVKTNGGGMWSIYTGNNKCAQTPTKDKWIKFQSIFPDLPDYESFGEVFHNSKGKGCVLDWYQFYDKSEKRHHPTQKPTRLVEYLIETYTNKDAVVLDFVMGGGTTGVACMNTGRNFIGIELDQEYFEIAEKRILFP
tara:strand:+ start:9612 stop:10487 length:876 start_codon:yes stop_codon:yes gene_type:complete